MIDKRKFQTRSTFCILLVSCFISQAFAGIIYLEDNRRVTDTISEPGREVYNKYIPDAPFSDFYVQINPNGSIEQQSSLTSTGFTASGRGNTDTYTYIYTTYSYFDVSFSLETDSRFFIHQRSLE